MAGGHLIEGQISFVKILIPAFGLICSFVILLPPSLLFLLSPSFDSSRSGQIARRSLGQSITLSFLSPLLSFRGTISMPKPNRHSTLSFFPLFLLVLFFLSHSFSTERVFDLLYRVPLISHRNCSQATIPLRNKIQPFPSGQTPLVSFADLTLAKRNLSHKL